MNIIIGSECIACGACEALCPKVFKVVEGRAVVNPEADLEAEKACIDEAIAQCPVSTISWQE